MESMKMATCHIAEHYRESLKTELFEVLTTDTAHVKRLYCCVTHVHFPAAFCFGRNLEVYRL